MFHELKDAFKNGVLGASTRWRKVYRWAILATLWLVSVTCIALAFIAPNFGGNLIHGITFAVNGVTFFIMSGTAIFMFSSTEHHDRTMASLARTREILRGGWDA